MSRRSLSISLILLSGIALLPTPSVRAQNVLANHEWCDDDSGDSRSERFCEVQEFTVDARDLVRVNAEPNGSIRVEGWDRNEISLLAKVQAWSRSGDPKEIAEDIRIETERTISADGPRMGRREGWSVSFRLMVPRGSDLDLESTNGGLQLSGVSGDLDLETTNGGIKLEEVGGTIHGRTQNGGIRVLLSESRWAGEEMDMETTNGSVTLTVPEDFQADLETGTVNGSFQTDFPITIQGRFRSRRISTQLNGGGPTVRLMTTNGSVRLRTR